MTFTIDLTEETVARLEEEATREGVDAAELARRLIEQALPAATAPKRQLVGYGRLSHLARGLDDFHRDRQADRDRENQP
jgi:hypothetical protein